MKPRTIAIVSSKGGVGKTTVAANLGAYVADSDDARRTGQRVLLIDLDIQPTLTSYYPLAHPPRKGILELLSTGSCDGVITPTVLPNVDVVASNDPYGQLTTLLLHAPDGRVRLRKLIWCLAHAYDLVIIDTQGARSILMESALLAADEVISPIPPQTLAAREFIRGTVSLVAELKLAQPAYALPPLLAVLNMVDRTIDAQQISTSLREELFSEFDSKHCRLLRTVIPAMTVYREAATHQVPAHHYEPRRPLRRKTPCAAEVMAALAEELDLVSRPSLGSQAQSQTAARVQIERERREDVNT